MPSLKRNVDGSMKEGNSSLFMPMFQVFRDELDAHHDRRERIIKASRDITAMSKKMIFALQRVRTLKNDLSPKIASDVQEKGTAIQTVFQSIAPDLKSVNAWRYQRQISGGIQEFMEAVSFEYYLRHQTLIIPEEASKLLPGDIELTVDDYVLGIFDLVGELMRFAITAMAMSGQLPGSRSAGGEDRDMLADLRVLRSQFEELDTSSCDSTFLGKDTQKKMSVMKECVHKVEVSVYGMIIRGRERPQDWVLDHLDDGALTVESY